MIKGLLIAVAVVVFIGMAPAMSATTVTVFSDNFESGTLSKWTQDSQKDWFASTHRDNGGSYSAEVDGPAVDAALISPELEICGDATITFQWYIETALDSGEYVAFDVSTDGGATWVEKKRIRGKVDTTNVWTPVTVVVPGVDTIKLRFRGKASLDGEDSNVDNVVVKATYETQPPPPPPANVSPTASFTTSPAAPEAGQSVNFTDTSTDPDGTVVGWEWDFGDGTTSTARNPSHTYNAAGSYQVTLSVVDDDGDAASVIQTVDVVEVPICRTCCPGS